MPQSKKPRKKYRTRHPEGPQLPINIRFSAKAEFDLQFIPHTELDNMLAGTANEFSLGAINFRINWGYVMAGETFDNPEVREALEKALGACRSIIARYHRLGKVGCTGEEYRLVGDALRYTDEMQKASTRREQLAAVQIVDAVVDWRLKGKE
jgi:hypothetical protein